MYKKRYFSNRGKGKVIKHVYEEGMEKTTHIKGKKRYKNPLNKKAQRLVSKARPESKPLSHFIKPSEEISSSTNFNTAKKSVLLDNCEIHANYGTTQAVLMVKDPFWIYAYWEISSDSLESLKRIITEEEMQTGKTVLRMYDVALVDFNGMNANSYFDIEVGSNSGSWYVKLWHDNAFYIGEIGLKTVKGSFHSLARSNCVHTPRITYSPRREQIFMTVKDNEPVSTYVRTQLNLPQAGGIHRKHVNPLKRGKRVFYLSEDEIREYYSGLSKPLRDIVSRRLSSHYGSKLTKYGFLFEGESEKEMLRILAGFPKEYFLNRVLMGSSEELILLAPKERSIGGASEFIQERIKQQNFFFELQAELIVYGRTKPNAKVELCGKEIELRNDGTFSLRFMLPDGKIPLEFKATSHDKTQTRKINTYVERKTHYPGGQK